jgi:FAD/FMN-containing dehydrogenase
MKIDLLTDPAGMVPYCTDWRGRFTGQPIAIAFPKSTAEVHAVVRACRAHRIPIVTQGGNTGLSGGATPDSSASQLLLNLSKLNHIRSIDLENATITVEAGATLEQVQQQAKARGLLFPVDLTARGSATIGGLLATNAGGTAVIRYGNARRQCLGLEVVTASGEIWSGLRGLRKDNTGYDLRDLYIGSEGTLGVITAAVLALEPAPKGLCTAWVEVETISKAIALLQETKQQLGSLLTAFELMSPTALAPVLEYFPEQAGPLRNERFSKNTPLQSGPYFVLIESSSQVSQAHAQEGLEQSLAKGLEQELVLDASTAQSLAQAESFWHLREQITMAAAEDGPQIKLDVALPISRIDDFCKEMSQALEQALPGVRLSNFGHLGDGNLHFNLAAPKEWLTGLPRIERHAKAKGFVEEHEPSLRRLVHDAVMSRGGSISAEHGLGQLRRDEAAHYKSPVELALMRSIKQALDPMGLFNPGKVL